MKNLTTATATPQATRFCMSALPSGSDAGSPFKGRHMGADIAYTAVRVSAFPKGVVPGVRAWSPPI